MSNKKSFVMYDNWGSMLCMMSDEDAGKFIKAMARYSSSGRSTDFDNEDIAYAFDAVKEQLDIDKAKFDKKVERMLAVKEKTKNEKSDQITNQKSNQITSEKSSQKSNQIPASENENENENVISKDIINCVESNDSTCPSGALERGRKKEHRYYQDCVKAWNELAEYGIPKIKDVEGTTRKRLVNARRKQYGDSFVKDIVERVRGSDFLQGRTQGKNGKPFPLTFDWAIKPENCAKILEGNYDNRDSSAGTGNGDSERDRIEQLNSGINWNAVGL